MIDLSVNDQEADVLTLALQDWLMTDHPSDVNRDVATNLIDYVENTRHGRS